MENIIRAVYCGSRYTTTKSVFQIDKGDVLQFVGLDLPEYYEVHFSNSKNDLAKRVIATGDSVVIPSEFMKHGKKEIFAWVYLTPEADVGYTPYQVTIPLNLRSDISDAEPDPEQDDIVEQAIAALNDGVERAETAADNAEGAATEARETAENVKQAVEDALQEAKESGEFDGKDGANGVTYTPTVDAEGNISWVNDGGLPNPQPRNIKGPAGKDGSDGKDGFSPTISVEDIECGHRVTITDKTGPHSFDVMDGSGGGAVDDVQIDGTSIVQDGVANVPVASYKTFGVTKLGAYNGTTEINGVLTINQADDADVKSGATLYKPIGPRRQHISTFFGLAKAAGADMASIASTTVGQYPEAQKSAISEMLNGSVAVSGTTPSITALPGVRYVCGEVSTLDITIPESGIVDITFESGATATVLTITAPTGVTLKWANGFDPTALEANTTYEINIMDGLGVAASWT